jgi:hypothetical protein
MAIQYNKDDAKYVKHSAASSVTVKSGGGIVHRLIVGASSSGATQGAVILFDGETTQVVNLPTGCTSNTYEIGIRFDTSIIIYLGHADDEVTVAYT